MVVRGTTIGTVTDVNGRFFLDIPSDPSTLVFSFIGFASQEVEVRPGSEIVVVMEEDVQHLQEVVVTGYGEQKALMIRGFSSALSGKVAGITFTSEGRRESDELEQRPVEDERREAEQ